MGSSCGGLRQQRGLEIQIVPYVGESPRNQRQEARARQSWRTAGGREGRTCPREPLAGLHCSHVWSSHLECGRLRGGTEAAPITEGQERGVRLG